MTWVTFWSPGCCGWLVEWEHSISWLLSFWCSWFGWQIWPSVGECSSGSSSHEDHIFITHCSVSFPFHLYALLWVCFPFPLRRACRNYQLLMYLICWKLVSFLQLDYTGAKTLSLQAVTTRSPGNWVYSWWINGGQKPILVGSVLLEFFGNIKLDLRGSRILILFWI